MPQGQIYVGVGEPDNQIKIFAADRQAGQSDRSARRPAAGRPLDRRRRAVCRRPGARRRRATVGDGKRLVLPSGSASGTSKPASWSANCSARPATAPRAARFVPPIRRSWSAKAASGGSIPKPARPPAPPSSRATAWKSLALPRSPDGRTYLFVASTWAFAVGPLRIFQRLGDGQYKLRSTIFYADEQGPRIAARRAWQAARAPSKTMVWSDANDDGQRQPDEISGVDGEMRFSGWYMWLTPDRHAVQQGQTIQAARASRPAAHRATIWPSRPTMPAARPGLGRRAAACWPGANTARDHSWMRAFDIASGKQLWQYPDTFVGVHGSHNAPPPEIGLIRGSYPPCGAVKLPEPIGNVWVIPTNVGEWHMLTEQGYYLTRLFQPDPLEGPVARGRGAGRQSRQRSARHGRRGFWRLGHAGPRRQALYPGRQDRVLGYRSRRAGHGQGAAARHRDDRAGRHAAGREDARGLSAGHRGPAAAA